MDIKEYEEFCKNSKYGNFMQSADWAKVKKGWIPEYVAVRDERGKINGCTLVLVKKIPILNTAMLYAPRGFVCDTHDSKTVRKIFEQIKLIAEKYHAYTLKTDPLIDETDFISIKNLIDLGFVYHGEKQGYDNTQCRENYVLDIKDKSCDEVFANFKSKWRYNIRLAMRKGVECKFCGEDELDDFMELMKETGRRDGFEIRSEEYFRNFLQAFHGNAKLCIAKLDGKVLSGALLVNYANVASEIGVSEPTIKTWISILERTGIVYLLQPYSASALNRAIKTPKIYFRDTGLACYLTRWLTADALKHSAVAGNMFETFMVSEILKSYTNEGKDYKFTIFYYRGKDKKVNGENEIDLIIEEDGVLYPVEIKMSGNPKANMGAANPVLDKVKDKTRGMGVILCLIDKKTFLRENLVALPIEYI